ncbi:MAG: hypothetical protein QME71_02820 [Dehalococcoidia bacterium]|nr:hypothetical protein [Dehalococcoidia bacterium]
MPVKTRIKKRQRRGAPWTEEEDAHLIAIADLPPRVVADLMQRSWLACRRRLVYLRADGSGPVGTSPGRTSKR